MPCQTLISCAPSSVPWSIHATTTEHKDRGAMGNRCRTPKHAQPQWLLKHPEACSTGTRQLRKIRAMLWGRRGGER
eukprot:10178249-Alexandrium_andersonii.AAC.1